MNTDLYGELAMELQAPQVNVAALADVIHDLIAGGLSHLHDGRWLDKRATAAGLDRHEHSALEALRARLLEGGTLTMDTPISQWG